MQETIYLRILFASLLATVGVACTGDDVEEPLCAQGVFDPLDDVNLDIQADYVDLRDGTQILFRRGEPCRTARDQAACRTQFDGVALDDGGLLDDGLEYLRKEACASLAAEVDLPNVARFFVVTSGDQVFTVSSRAEVDALLGPIDTTKEAALMAYLHGYELSCQSEDRDGEPFAATGQPGSGGFELTVQRTCSDVTRVAELQVDANGTVDVTGTPDTPSGGCGVGRNPRGLRTVSSRRPMGLGTYFAEMSTLEAASVVAFAQIEADLVRFGAPESLVQGARKARADEVRHARSTARLARRHGARVRRPRVAEQAPVSLVEFARHNAVEGCVRETYGALVAQRQSMYAEVPEVRALMVTIAAEETEHAALSWQIAAWAESQLDAQQRASLRELRRQTVAELTAAALRDPAADVAHALGLPTPQQAGTLLRALAPHLVHGAAGA